MEKNQGWIQLHRQLLDHPLWEEKRKFSKAEAWIDLLLLANHKPNPVMIKNRLIQCDRGETLRSLDTLRKRWSWSKSAVRRFLKVLEEQEQIVTKNETQTTRISICKYSEYQGLGNANETDSERKRNASKTQTAPNNNDNNDKKDICAKTKVIPPDARNKNKAQQKRLKVNFNNAVMDEIGSWFYKKPRLWTVYEAIMLDQIRPPQEEREAMARLYASDYEYRRKSLSTLLANWSEELDRGENYFTKPQAEKRMSAKELKENAYRENMIKP